MSSRRLFWVFIALFFLVSYLASSGVELVVDYLWFDSVGYVDVYLTVITAELVMGLVAGVIAFALLYGNLAFAIRQVGEPQRFLPREVLMTPLGQMMSQRNLQRTVAIVSAVIALLAGLALSAGWETPLLYLHGADFGWQEPIFGRDPAFYIFTLPFFDQVQSFLWSIGFVALLGAGGIYLLRMQAERTEGEGNVISLTAFPAGGRWHLGGLGAFLLVLMAVGLYLDRFEELHRAAGLFTGPGYADINGTLPVLALKAATAVVAGGVLVYALGKARYRMLVGLVGLFVVIWVGGNIYSSVLQRYVVAPNELDRERPYLQNHIVATNKAFELDSVRERPLSEDVELTAKDIERNQPTVNNVRLWDHEPLLDTFAQIQEIRTYYEFVSVDNDRYEINGDLRQTMLSPRELNPDSLPSRTWVNERLIFTHGYGVTAGPVNRVNEQGLPVLYVQDLPPKSSTPALDVSEPDIYFGELSSNYVFVKTRQQEFDYPRGDENVFASYDGDGGVLLDSLWKRLVLATYVRDVKLLLSDDFTPDTRVLLFRQIMPRVQRIAPFLDYDQDPYMVVHKGRLKWVLDAYTTTSRYPYAEQVPGLGNYMRNPVKVVVDAKDGTVAFYLRQPDEPIVRAYSEMFPGMFRPLSDMDPDLRAHLRHPADYFRVQANMYATYHMLDVNTFYNKEDQWSIPVVGNRRMEPYYLVMKLPGDTKEEFILMLPFTPRLKDNMAAWMVARSDGEHLSNLVVYTFPKQKLIYGPKQIVARINQDPLVSQQITLWDQSGSNVIRGTLLVIPIEQSLIYVQPLYLRAEEGRIPELKRVIVGYQNNIAMGLDLEDALKQIFGEAQPPPLIPGAQGAAVTQPQQPGRQGQQPPPPGENLTQRAMRQYQELNDAAQQGNWQRFGERLQQLGDTLQQLSRQR